MASTRRNQDQAAAVARARTRFVRVDGTDIAYRETGSGTQTPLVALIHLGANLDAWDPEVVDALAVDRRVVLLGYRGVGRSGGRVRDVFDDMAADAVAAIRALGLSRIDLFGLSMGGMVAQAILEREPGLVRRLVLAGTGPTGGPGLDRMTGVMLRATARSIVTGRPAASLLFFTGTAAGKGAAADYQDRLKRARTDRDRRVGAGVLRAQLRAVARWGAQSRPGRAIGPEAVITFHGDDDIVVPVANAAALRSVFPALEIVTFPDAGHGVVSEHRAAVTDRVRAFLGA